MPKWTLGLLDPDKDYVELIVEYIRSSDYSAQFAVKRFTNQNGLNAYFQESGRLDVLMTDAALLPEIADVSSAGAVVAVRTDDFTPSEDSQGVSSVFKYQPLNQLMAKLSGICMEKADPAARYTAAGQKATTLAVYSASGGCGKSTVAANLAQVIAGLGHRTFHLNLEWLASAPFFPERKDNDGFSRLLYYLKADPGQLASRMAVLKNNDPYRKVDYLDALGDLKEIQEISGQDISILIQAIAGSGLFDYVVLDLPSSMDERVKGSFSCADEVIWVVLDDLHCLYKTSRLLREWEKKAAFEGEIALPPITFVLNKFTGKLLNDFAGFGINVGTSLPYIPHWKSISSTSQLMDEPLFQKQIAYCFHRFRCREAVSA